MTTTRTSRPQQARPQGKRSRERRIVVLDAGEFERLQKKADEWVPALPEPDGEGTYPAVQALRVSLARKIIRDRRRAGLSQAELARRARIRLATLCQIEQAERSASPAIIEKIEKAVQRAVRVKS